MTFPIYEKIKNVPNHQPEWVFIIQWTDLREPSIGAMFFTIKCKAFVQIFPSFNAGKTMSQWGPKSQVGRLVLKANKSWKPPTNDGLHVMVSNSHKVHGIMSNSLGPNKKKDKQFPKSLGIF